MNKSTAKRQAVRFARLHPPTKENADNLIIPVNCEWYVHFTKTTTENGLIWEFSGID